MSLFATYATFRRASGGRVFAWRGGAAARFLAGVAVVGAGSLLTGQHAQATPITYIGGTTGVWSNSAVWSPAQVPTLADIVTFNGAAANTVTLGGNQAVLGMVFAATSGTTAVRATAAGQILALGTSGIQFGSTQTDLGGGGANTMVVSLMGSQSWTGSSASGLIQLNNGIASASTQSLTNGTAGAVNLTFDGVSTGGKTLYGRIDDGSLGGTTALTLATTGTFGSLNLQGANTYSGGTTFSQGFLQPNNNQALGTGALTISGAALSGTVFRTFSSGLVGGVALTNNNVQNWNADFTLGGAQNIDFGTGAVTLGASRTVILNATSLPVNYTEGGSIGGAGFGLSVTSTPAGGNALGINSQLILNGANTYTGGTSINGGLLRFGNAAAIPSTGAVTLNGGALAVGAGTAFPTLASVATAGIVRTTGSLALTGDSSENFTAPNGNILLGAALGSVARYTGTLTPSGTVYDVGGGGGTIVFTNDNAFTGARSITTGVGNTASGGGGTVIITGQNTATGGGSTPGVFVNLGTLQVSSLGSLNSGPSNLGSFTVAANGVISLGYSGGAFSQLRYTGPGETTDRGVFFDGFSGATTGLDASGTGAVVFNGAYTAASNSTNRFLTLRGINTGANTVTAGIGTQAANPGGLNLTKQQRGNWTLTGSNNFAGTSNVIAINGGTLTGDYSTNANIFGLAASNTALTLGGGNLAILGTAAGGATQTLGTTVLTANSGQSNVNVTGNGTAGSALLTMGTTFTRNAGTFLNFNLLNGGQVATATTALSNGVLVGTGTPAAAFTVTDGTGTDFATVSGGQIAKLGAATALPAAGSASTTNYALTGSQTLTASESANTVRIDTSGGGGTLTLGANSLTLTGGTLLMSGSNAYTISGTRLAPAAGTITLANYGTGALTVAAAVTDGGGSVTKVGPGLVDLTSAQAYTGATNIFGGVLRLSNATSGTGNIALNTGGILEIGADLNGATAGDFSRQVGTGGGQIQWTNGDGGFSAAGANRAVSLTNNLSVAGGQLVWGSTSGNNFVSAPNASPNFVKDGFALLLSSSTSNATLDFQNPIDFVNMARTVEVGNGTAAVDAVLSGVLSSSDYSGGLYKTGAGTLAVTAANTYTGQTAINGGTLQIGNGGTTGSLAPSSAIVDNANLTVNRSNAVTQGTDFSTAPITGTGSLTQAGTGITTLTAANTYAGPTTVSGGELRLANTSGSATGAGIVTLSSGVVSGTGTSTGALTVTNGSVLAAGNNTAANFGTAGTLGVGTSGGATLANSVLDFDLSSAFNGINDLLTTGGTLNLGTLAFNFNELTPGTLDTTNPYTLISGAGGVSGFTGGYATTFLNDTGSGYTATYSLSGNNLQVQFAPIAAAPEPSAWAAFAIGLLGLGGLALKARRRSLQAA